MKYCKAGLMIAAFMLSACQTQTASDLPAPKAQVDAFAGDIDSAGDKVIFDKNTNLLGGWNHIPNFPEEFPGLNFPGGVYRVDSKPALANGVYQYTTTLVKKYADWNHQHGNGLKASFEQQPLTFADIKGVDLVIKLRSDATHIPTLSEYMQTYRETLSRDQLLELDNTKAQLLITLIGENDDDPSLPTFNASYLLEIDPATQSDQWLSISIPAEAMDTFVDQNYAGTQLTEKEAARHEVVGLRIMAETASTRVVRNYLLDDFSDQTPKLFKEVGLAIRYAGIDK